MDEIRKKILHEQEIRKARLSACLDESFSSLKQENNKDIVKGDDYDEYPDLINSIKTPSVADALDILSKAGEEDIFEKAKHQDGDMHPNGKWVWVASAAGGKGDWRTIGGRAHKKAGGGGSASSTSGSGATAPQSATSKTPKAKSTKFIDTSKIVSKIPDKEFKSITHMLEKINPDDMHSESYLEDMTDKELNNFWACADHFKTDYKHINQSTRERCSKWKDMANAEMQSREEASKKKKQQTPTSDTTKQKKQPETPKSDNSGTEKQSKGKKISEDDLKFIKKNAPKIGDTLTIPAFGLSKEKKIKVKDFFISKKFDEPVISVLGSDNKYYELRKNSKNYSMTMHYTSSFYKKDKERSELIDLDGNIQDKSEKNVSSVKESKDDSGTKSLVSTITSLIRSDQGSVSDDAKTKKIINNIASAAQKFFEKNPKLDKDKVLEHAVYNSDDDGVEFMEKYGKLKGASALNSALDKLFDE